MVSVLQTAHVMVFAFMVGAYSPDNHYNVSDLQITMNDRSFGPFAFEYKHFNDNRSLCIILGKLPRYLLHYAGCQLSGVVSLFNIEIIYIIIGPFMHPRCRRIGTMINVRIVLVVSLPSSSPYVSGIFGMND